MTGGEPDTRPDRVGVVDPTQALLPQLADERTGAAAGIWLVTVPGSRHPAIAEIRGLGPDAQGRGLAIVPDMPDEARRDAAQRLRNGGVDWLVVTGERFEDTRFLRFLSELRIARLVILGLEAAGETYCDGLLAFRRTHAAVPASAYFPPTVPEQIRWARAERAGIQIAAPSHHVHDTGDKAAAAPEQRVAPAEGVRAKNQRRRPCGITLPDVAGWERAAPYFDDGTSLPEVGAALDRDPSWCLQALQRYLGERGGTNPLPWIPQPTYITVAMAAGQAETNDPRVVLPILGERVSRDEALVILIVLENRARQLVEAGDGAPRP